MSVTIQELIAGSPSPLCIAEDGMVGDALRLMMEHDYSQLPVVNGEGAVVGIITGDSIARALNLLGLRASELRVSNAYVPAKTLRTDSEIEDLMDALRGTFAVPVVDESGRLVGIVTNCDTTAYFHSRAEAMMDVEDVENSLKDCIRADIAPDAGELTDAEITVKLTPRSPERTFDRLSFNDYISMFMHGSRWRRIAPVVDLSESACRKMLEEVRDIRNDLFHFRRDISAERRYALKYCRNWLDRHQQAIIQALLPEPEREPLILYSRILPRDRDGGGILRSVPALRPSPQLAESSAGKYDRLATYLQELSEHLGETDLSFARIESIIGGELPRSAYEHRSWWANDESGHSPSRHWLDVGWRVSSVNIAEKTATFSRMKAREDRYRQFFARLLQAAAARGLGLPRISPTGQSYMELDAIRDAAGEKLAFIGCSFARRERFRVEFYIDSGDTGRDRNIFDDLHALHDGIEPGIDSPLEWEALERQSVFRIAAYTRGSITSSDEDLTALTEWAVDTLADFFRVFRDQMGARIIEFASRAAALRSGS
jgi:hypothetical protein